MRATARVGRDRTREGTDRTTATRVELIGTDGNAFAVLGCVFRALRDAGWSQEEIDSFKREATVGDYDHLLGRVMKYLDVGGAIEYVKSWRRREAQHLG